MPSLQLQAQALWDKERSTFWKKLGWEDEDLQPGGEEALTVNPESKHKSELLIAEGGFIQKVRNWDFPGGPVVNNLPCNSGDAGQGTKIPHAMEQLSLNTAATEHARSGAHVPRWKILHDAMKIPHATTKTQCSQINV